ncbi:MAG: AraC family transcriptional regulator [Planctomycetota bacterium]
MQPIREATGTDPGSSFWSLHFSTPQFVFNWHIHTAYELTCIARGSGTRWVGDNIAQFSDGDLVLIGPDLPHTWQSTPDSRRNLAHGVIFDPERWGDILALPETRAITGLLNNAKRGCSFPLTDRHARLARQRLAKLHVRDGLARWTELLAILELLTRSRHTILTSIACAAPDPLDHGRITAVCDEILRRFREPLRQSDLAKSVGLQSSSFCRFFKRQTGRRFIAYVHELRIGYACQRLIANDDDITGIALDAGFSNLSNFNRIFLRLKGVSPRAFRQAYHRR